MSDTAVRETVERGSPVVADRRGPPVVASCVLVLGWLGLSGTTGRFVNPDAAAYVSLAEQWLEGDVVAAVSGYWGPLLSWLLAPLLAFGVPDLLAARTVVLAGAVATVWVGAAWLDRLRVGRLARWCSLAALVALLLWHAVYGIYPETVLNALLLLAVLLLTGPQPRPAHALLGGALLGLGYLTKAVGLPLGLGVVAAVTLLRLLQGDGHADGVGAGPATSGTGVSLHLRQALLALLGLALVAGPWLGVLSLQRGTPTWSTAAEFNARLVGSRGNPLLHAGLYALPFEDARSPWDAPTTIAPTGGVEARPGASAGSPSALLGSVRVTLGAVARRVAVPSVLAAVAVVGLLRRWRRGGTAALGLAALAALAAGDVLGYLLVIVIERYLWLPMLAAVLLAAATLQHVVDAGRPRVAALLGVATVLSVAAGAAGAVAPRLSDHAEVVTVAEELADDGLLRGADVAGVRDWSRTLALCVRLDCQHRGSTGRQPVDDLPALRAADVAYVVRWQDAPGADGGQVEVLAVTPDGLTETVAVAVGTGDGPGGG